MNEGLYNLNDAGEPVEVDYADWKPLHAPRNNVRKTLVGKRVLVSTVFLGYDPVWETLTREADGDNTIRCGGSRKDALRMHVNACRRVRRLLKQGILK